MNDNQAFVEAIEQVVVPEGTPLVYHTKDHDTRSDHTNVDAKIVEILERLAIFDGMEARVSGIELEVTNGSGARLATVEIPVPVA